MSVETTGESVRSIYNPAKVGISTGRTRRLGGTTYVYVRYPNGEEEPTPVDELELAPRRESRAQAFASGRFSAPTAVARAIVVEKLGGQLTDVIYSIGSGHAQFYPHQFKPVVTFFSSTLGRILIADEVGLGKTIEAIYIWRELQARMAARRLLVICPAVLKTKWQGELRERFSIDATIVKPAELLELAQSAIRDPSKTFFAIAGLESIRPRKSDDEEAKGRPARAELAELLRQNEAGAEFSVFDLVIIDEAHYLRNPETANNAIGHVLAGAAANLILLTATPIQIGSENLFHLLRLIDPDQFSDLATFERIRAANTAVTRALNSVRRSPVDAAGFSAAIQQLASDRLFASDLLIEQWRDGPPDLSQTDERARVARLLEQRSLISNVFTRTRKRDVIQDRVIRESNVIEVTLNPTERSIYNRVSSIIRQRAFGADTVNTLALIARQRQLASSIPAALENWKRNPETVCLLNDDGLYDPDLEDGGEIDGFEFPDLSEIDISALELIDSKYALFRKFLANWLKQNPSEKIIVFSFYRGTLHYLHRRLASEEVASALIVGGMGDAKDKEIERFADPDGPSVLLSSEVGSEGIDLQFSRVVVNYDLPWNPMRVEQRIGRVDRLGQKSNKINVVSFVLKNTIEEIILERLYVRIGVFEESIGDIEEILGESIDEVVIDYFRDKLTDEQISQRLELNALAASQHRQSVSELENEVPELTASRDFILSSVQASRDSGRWIRPDDIREFILDFLLENYPGSKMESDVQETGIYRLLLSPSAGAALGSHMERHRPYRGTRLRSPGAEVPIVFDPELQTKTKFRPRPEVVDITHPLVAFARSQAVERTNAAQPVAAMIVRAASTEASPGKYVFATDLWRFGGLRREIRLQNMVRSLEDGLRLEPSLADKLVDAAIQQNSRADHSELTPDDEQLLNAFVACERDLDDLFIVEGHEFRQENSRRVSQARLLVTERCEAKLRKLIETIDLQRRSNDAHRRRAAQMNEGRMKKLVADRDQRLAAIQAAGEAETTRRGVAGGIVIVE